MRVSFFETGHYRPPSALPVSWPVPPAAYDQGAGAQSYRGMVERLRYVEQLGCDWVSVAEHHYSPQRLTPSPIVVAAHLAACAKTIGIAVLGPIVSQCNPVQVAEELAMLDILSEGRLVVGLLRGITGEYLSYGLNPTEARERTTEAIELILKAWTEPYPFGWEGRHFRFRTVSVWPRSLQQPHPRTYALGGSRESCEVAARNHLGLGVAYGPVEVVARATRYYREMCAQHGWKPTPEQIIYRANILLARSDKEAKDIQEARQQPADNFPLCPAVRDGLLQLDSRNIAGEARPSLIGGVLPTNFVGGPDTVVEQIKACREQTGAGVVDLMFQTPSSNDNDGLMHALELFGQEVLPRIRDI